jgi:N utilization substance protein A
MNKKIPLKSIVNSVSNEKGISKEIIFEAIKEAILCATKKKYKMLNVETQIDQETGFYKTYALYKVTNELKNFNPFKNISIIQAKKYNPNIKIGDIVKKEIDSIIFGRIDAQIAKQIIKKRVKNAKKEITTKEINKNKILSGIIKKTTEEETIISINDEISGILPKRNSIQNDSLKIGNKIKACFLESINEREIKLTRTSNDMLYELLKNEIPEIKSGLIEIKEIARNPGIRAKVSVKTNVKNLDPIGACIGPRGTRIQNISNELNGEKIDIIKWDQNIFKYIINIFNKTEIKHIEIDEKLKLIKIFVNKETLSKIIGKNGQNIKLITKMIKWNLNINEYNPKI